MKKENSKGTKPYLRPVIETNDFMVESGIAASYASGFTDSAGNNTSIDFTVVGDWSEE